MLIVLLCYKKGLVVSSQRGSQCNKNQEKTIFVYRSVMSFTKFAVAHACYQGGDGS
jgi:hypothetical protein